MRFIKLLSFSLLTVLASASPALAAAEGAAPAGMGILGMAVGIGLAVFGGAMAQGKVASTALDGISRNPGASGQMQTPLILGLALVESLVILAWLGIFIL